MSVRLAFGKKIRNLGTEVFNVHYTAAASP